MQKDRAEILSHIDWNGEICLAVFAHRGKQNKNLKFAHTRRQSLSSMDLQTIDLHTLKDVGMLLQEANTETRVRWTKALVRGKPKVHIVTNDKACPMYEDSYKVSTRPTDLRAEQGSYFVFDDCFPDGSWMQDRTLQALISFPRSLGITSVFAFHRPVSIPPRIRWDLDIVCIGSNPSDTARRRIYESFFGDTCSFEDLCALMDRYTQNGGLLVQRRDRAELQLLHAQLTPA